MLRRHSIFPLKSSPLVVLSALLVFALCAPRVVSAKSDIGVLVLAVGGSSPWTRMVKKTGKQAELPYPTRVFFGYGRSVSEVRKLRKHIRWFEAKGINSVLVIPLITSPHSRAVRQWRYLLDEDVRPGYIQTPFFPIHHRLDLQFAGTLNDDNIVADILFESAQAISTHPELETLFIVARGSPSDLDNSKWNAILKRLAQRVADRGSFERVVGLTVRDHTPPRHQENPEPTLREWVESIEKSGGRVLIVPLILSPGGVEHRILVELRGLTYTFNSKTLLPDYRISQWIRSKLP